jgi:predicted Zn-dependent protease
MEHPTVVNYALENEKWASQPITWSFANFNLTDEIDPAPVLLTPITSSTYQAIVASAFDKWASVANIQFVQVPETSAPASYATASDIRVGFTNFNTTVTGELGLTQYKYIGSNLYQDTLIGLENPDIQSYAAVSVSLYQVALHEIGHALGLAHASDPYAVMNGGASAANPDLNATDIAAIQVLYGPPNGGNMMVADTSDASSFWAKADPYTGGVSWLRSQFIVHNDVATITKDNLNIMSTAPSCFIQSGSGDDAIDVSYANGNNVVDGGSGSNYLKGGSGNDVFFVDDRLAGATWDTLVNFHANDQLTMFGIDRPLCVFLTADNYGVAGASGLTLFASPNGGKSWAAATLAGYTTADLSNGRLTLVDGYDQATASHYLWVEAH